MISKPATTEQIYEAFKISKGICTDTRKLFKDCFFVALKGGNFDGNTYALTALEKGAKFALVDNPDLSSQHACIYVENCLTSLQDLAGYHRSFLNIPVIGITGSNGKTTTKELINAALSKKYKTHYTKGNFNNHIGVPLTLLETPLDTEIAIIEMGANHVGEIEELCKIARPSHGIITNIGTAHIEGFGGIEGVKRGKSELYRFIQSHKGTLFVNGSDQTLVDLASSSSKIQYYLGNQVGSYNSKLLDTTPFIKFEHNNGRTVNTQLVGNYNFNNIVSALCIADFFDVPEEQSIEAIKNYAPNNNRSQVVRVGHKMILLDAYNANPSSMKAALSNLHEMNSKNKAVILGDMFELGEASDKFHGEIVDLCVSKLRFDMCIFCGEQFSTHASNESKNTLFFNSRADLLKYISQNQLDYEILLIKGSRGMGLEELVPNLS